MALEHHSGIPYLFGGVGHESLYLRSVHDDLFKLNGFLDASKASAKLGDSLFGRRSPIIEYLYGI